MSNTSHTFHPSAVAAVNQALVAIGEDKTVEELSPVSSDATARKAAFVYESARQKVLRDHAWTFARRDEPLAPTRSFAPCDAYPFYYARPPKAVRITGCFDSAGAMVFWVDAQKEIHCSRQAARCTYTADIEDLDKWNPDAFRALVLRLAADLAKAVTGRLNERELQERAYADQLAAAKLNDSRGGNAEYDAYGSNHYADAMSGGAFHERAPFRR